MALARVGLILTGGGARVAYQVGAIRALGEILPHQTNPFPILCGTSAGGINAAYLASRAHDWVGATDGIYHIWKNIALNDIYKTDGLSLSSIALAWITRTLIGGKSKTREMANYLLDTSPLADLLTREINFSAIRYNIDKKSLHALAISALQYFNDRTLTFFDASPEIMNWSRAGRMGRRSIIEMEHILASAAIPGFFPPVRIEDQFFGDGCVRQMNPLSPAIHLGASKLLCIGIRHVSDNTDSLGYGLKSPSIAQITGELFNSLFLDPLHADLERLKRINESVDRFSPNAMSMSETTLRKIPFLSLMPSRNLTEVLPSLVKGFPPYLRYLLHGIGASDKDNQGQILISYLAFFSDCIHPLIELGYLDTMVRKEEILEFMEV